MDLGEGERTRNESAFVTGTKFLLYSGKDCRASFRVQYIGLKS